MSVASLKDSEDTFRHRYVVERGKKADFCLQYNTTK